MYNLNEQGHKDIFKHDLNNLDSQMRRFERS
jgi:hypothetical protein